MRTNNATETPTGTGKKAPKPVAEQETKP